MCESSNPALSSLAKTVIRGRAGAQYYDQGQTGADFGNNPYQSQIAADYHPMTIDDVASKTGIMLATIIVLVTTNFFIAASVSIQLAMILTVVDATDGLTTILVPTLGKKYGSAPVTLTYAAFKGLFVGGISFMFTAPTQGVAAGALIMQAALMTLGVFIGMFFVYELGAVHVTPKLTRFTSTTLIGVLVFISGNLVLSLFGLGFPLRDDGMLLITFSLVCIGLVAFSFLIDFNQAGRLVHAGVPVQYAQGATLGLAVTLVWFYTEILRLLFYFKD